MSENKQDFPAKLAKARQQLEKARARVADLERQLIDDPPMQERIDDLQPYVRAFGNSLEGCQIVGYDWRYLYINDTAARYGRQAKDALLGRTVMECYAGIESTELFATLRRCMTERTAQDADFEFVYPDGSNAWFEFRIQPVPDGIFILTLDITERKRGEASARASEALLKLFVDRAPAALAMLDQDMKYLLVSERWLTDYRLSDVQVVGRSHYEVFPDIPERWKEIHRRCLAGAVERCEADPFPRADGSVDWVRWEISPWRKPDGTIGGILILTELITERQQAEEHVRTLNRTLSVLSDTNQTIVRERHMPTLFEQACRIAVDNGAFLAACIGLVDRATQRVQPTAQAAADSGLEALPLLGVDTLGGRSAAALALRAGLHVVYNDAAHDPGARRWRREARRLGCQSFAIFPLMIAEEVRGTLHLYANEANFFDDAELRVLDEMAGDIGFAMEFAEQEEQRQQAQAAVERYAQRLEILHEIDLGLIRGTSISALVESTLKHLRNLIPCQRADVMILDEDSGEAYVFAVGRDEGTSFSEGARIPIPPNVFEGYDARHLRVFDDIRIFEDIRPRARQFIEQGLISALSVMLMEHDQPMGVLTLNATTPGFFTAEYQDIAADVASQLSIGLHQMHLQEALARHAALLEQRVLERTAELQAAKEQVEAILDNSADGIVLVTPDLIIRQINSAFKRLFACDATGCIGQPITALVYRDDVDELTRMLRASLDGQAEGAIEVRAVRTDQSPFDAELRFSHITDDGLVCTIRDITERNAQERQLRYYASLQESVHDAVMTMDLQYRIQSWNQAAERIYGWKAEEVVGKNALYEILKAPRDSEAERARILQAFRERGDTHAEITRLRKDGTEANILASVTLLKDASGTPFGMVAVHHDITERKAHERQLRFQAGLQENVSDAVIVTDDEYRIQSWNRAAERIYGWRADEVVGKSTTRILKAETALSDDPESNIRLLREQGWWHGELRHNHKDGSVRHILGSVTLIKDEGEVPFGIVWVIRDNTEHKRAEEALRESEARYRQMFEQNQAVKLVVDPQTGVIVDANPAACAFYGYDLKTLKALHITDINVLPKDSVFTEMLHASAQTRPVFDFRHRLASGEIRDVEVYSGPVEIEGKQLLYSIIMDVTERKQADAALRESEARYRLLAENVTDVLVKIDPNGLQRFVSPSCYALLGYTPEEMVGLSGFEMMHPEDGAAAQATLADAIETGKTGFSFTTRIAHKAGHYLWVEVSNSIIRAPDSGTPLEIVAVIRDINERKRAEAALGAKLDEEREFQGYLRALHEITIELTQIDELDTFYERVVGCGLERLGFERLALFLYDATADTAYGTYETDPQGHPVYERHLQFAPSVFGVMKRAFEESERFYFEENAPLFENGVQIGKGWNAAAVLWNGTHGVGWLVADNLLGQKPASKALLDILGLYALTIGTLLAQKRVQVAQRESEARYRLLANMINDVVIRLTPTFDYLYVSPSSRTVLGYEPEELLGPSDFRRIHPDDAPAIRELIKRLVEQPGGGAITYRFLHKEGRYVWLESTGQAVVSEETGAVVEFVFSARDVTERKRAEAALLASETRLRESEQMLHLVLDTAPVRIFWKDRRSVYLGCNRLFAQDGGFASVADLVGKRDIDNMDDTEAATAYVSDDEAVMQTGIPKMNYEEAMTTASGARLAIETSKLPLRNSEGEIIGVLGAYIDITERKRGEEALRESEEKFRSLLDAAPVATIISDAAGDITLVNIQAETLFGFNRSELVGQSVDSLVPDYARERHPGHRAAYMAAPRVRHMESHLELFARRKDGSEFPAEIELSYIETKAGIMVMSFVLDISERRRVSAELEQQRSFLRNVIDVSPNLIFVKDRDSRYVLVNPMVAVLYNTTVEALIGKTNADFDPVHKEVDAFLEADRRVIATGEPLFIEEPVTNLTGQTRWFQTTKVPIVSADGKAKHVLGVATDITERKRSEAALRESEEKYRSLVETMRGGLAIFDVDERFTYANDRMCELLGYSRDELIGTRSHDYMDETNALILDTHLDQRRRFESSSYELAARHKSGRLVYLLVSGSPLLGKDGQFSGNFAVMTDITDQKQAEEMLRQALIKETELGELKSRFVSMASHEFRTPLATILALTETLSAYRHKMPEDQIEKRFDKIKEQVDHLKDIMEDVLLLARMQARRVEFNPVSVNLDDLCRSVLDEFQSRSDITNPIEFVAHAAPRQVILDKKLMRQILSNLVSNAIKYSPDAKPVQVSLEYKDDALVLAVSDHGIGIPQADLQHLFEPFHRAANVGAISGTGLGLVIAKESVELHSGTITVDSQIDVGTTFAVRIPLVAKRDHDHDTNPGD